MLNNKIIMSYILWIEFYDLSWSILNINIFTYEDVFQVIDYYSIFCNAKFNMSGLDSKAFFL